MKYLYGASVQGIQSFIFETNKLKEIVGASEIVEKVCTELFKEFYKGNADNIILSAAGNIKIQTDNVDDIKQLVKCFPKRVAEFAPGITISQAVVKCEGDEKDYISKLEVKLKEQRNRPMIATEISAIGIERSRRTGKSAVKYEAIKKDKRENIDSATLKKISTSKGNSLIKKLFLNAKVENFSNDMAELTNKKCKWLAVIHADGNGLGKIIQNLNEPIKTFSEKLNEATENAAKTAFDTVIQSKINNNIYPIRPIVIGGDDLTVICRADLALDFIQSYLKAFQENGQEYNLTASAGVSFVKESYPFHYAVDLAEQLCAESKKKSRDKAGITFHKIQSSFMDSYSEIKERELTAGDISFANGPYFLDELDELQNMVEEVQKKEAPKSGIRKWLSELHRDRDSAKQLMDRIVQINKNKYPKSKFTEKLRLGESAIVDSKTHLYDVLSIASLNGEG